MLHVPSAAAHSRVHVEYKSVFSGACSSLWWDGSRTGVHGLECSIALRYLQHSLCCVLPNDRQAIRNVGLLNLIDGTTYKFTQPKPNIGQLGQTK